MVLQAKDIESHVRDELDRMAGPEELAVRSLLVVPRMEKRAWDYGAAHQTYPCWIVMEHPASNTGVAYCAEGFGPDSPWGLLFLRGPHLGMGMDCSWYASLEDAFRESKACDLPLPPGYEVG